ncbi:MAG: peroxidase-related enzyme [Terriglobales bacterium]
MTYLRNQPHDEKDFPVFATIREQFGFLPNFFPAQTRRPDLVDAEINLMAAILLKEGALSRRQKEYIFLVCSAANLSTYCVTAHCEIVRMLHLEGPEPEQIAIDHVHAKIPIADKALLNFCAKLNGQPTKIGSSDIDALRTYGFSEQQIHEAIVTVGFAGFANIVAFGLGTVPDFHNRRIAEELGKARAEGREEPLPAVGK